MTQAVAVRRGAGGRLALLACAAAVAVVALSLIHLSQGTAVLAPDALWRALTGGAGAGESGAAQADAVLAASRLPRLAAGLVVGATLGAAGAALQSVSRNPLAAPDTLAVNAGAYLAVVAVAAFGISLPVLPAGAIAFCGGLIAAVVVLGLSRGGAGPVRLVLAGSALTLALSGVSGMLLLFYSQETTGLFAWGNGSLVQTGMDGVLQLLPLAVVAFAGLLVLCRRLDILALGDDGAASVGVNPRTTRAVVVVLAVLLSAVAVTIAGPIAFVGLCAPAIVRLLASRVPGLARHRAFLPASAVAGMLVVLIADVLLRAVFGGQAGVAVPTGIVTTVFGAGVLVFLAYRSRDTSSNTATNAAVKLRSRRAFVITLVVCCVALVAALVAAVLLGDARLLLGDVWNGITGRAGRVVSFVLDTRLPRVAAALLAGAALALAGTIVQAVSRNPLAEPAILGVVGGAGVGAIAVITAVPLASFWLVGGAALAGAAAAALLVFGLAARRGLEQNRLILIGIGVSSGATALTSLLIVLTDPFNGAKALVWLSGSTYGRTFPQVLPVLVVLLVAVPLLAAATRELDIVGLDPDTPRVLGVRLGRARLGLLAIAVALTAAAVAAVGVIAFVGLVAPHAARSLVGQRHARVLPVAALLGAILVSVADTVGRTLIAPAQIPVGLVTAVIGAPYFLWLLWRSRAEA
ncbi:MULTISPECIES: iron ABC transporter permease [unclassified Leifsonia]|uniref:iron ABC transporter permease n=1 Tax=unclassified Leifsonia TaxID=2663824 RepID=UPI00035CEA90|nr:MULTISPECIES: iron ABC transporter permease [unclassified Leifsonia]TDP99279.1 iron complex transport system permease protein [Leifsonia sp. 115AMFTsu3.1]